MIRGVVKEYNRLKSFGFIIGKYGKDCFFHVSRLREYLKDRGLSTGQSLSFDSDYSMKGDKAINVRTD